MNLYISRILKIIVFIILIVLLDQGAGMILRKLYFSQKTGPDYALNYSFQDCKADILIFGASQAQHNYDSRIISKSLNMSCYNAGQDGGHSIIMQYAQIKAITKRYSPKIILLDFYPNSIVRYPGDYDRLSILLPYYSVYPDLRPLIQLRGPYEKIKLLSAIYPFNSNVINIIRFNTSTRAARKRDFEGYIPLPGTIMNDDVLKQKAVNVLQSDVDSNMVSALKNIISLCKEKNISLIIVSSPIFPTQDERKLSSTRSAKLSLTIMSRENIKYHDCTFDPIFAGRKDLFKDKFHLNEKGATIFSEEMAEWIKGRMNGLNQHE